MSLESNNIKDNNENNNKIVQRNFPIKEANKKINSNSQDNSSRIAKDDVLFFKNDLLKDLKTIENKLNLKIENQSIMVTDKLERYKTKLEAMAEKIHILGDKITINFSLKDKIDELYQIKNKIEAYLVTQDVRIEATKKDLKEAMNNYDKILLESVIYSKLIGPNAKFNNFHEFIDYVLLNLNQLNASKEKNNLDLKGYKKKLESLIQNLRIQIESIKKNNMEFSSKGLKEIEKKFNEINEEHNFKFIQVRMENSNYAKTLEGKFTLLNDIVLQTEKMKKDIEETIKYEINKIADISNNINLKFDDYQKEFNSIKKRFIILSDYIQNHNFQKSETKNVTQQLKFNKNANSLIEKENPENFIQKIEDYEESKNIKRKNKNTNDNNIINNNININNNTNIDNNINTNINNNYINKGKNSNKNLHNIKNNSTNSLNSKKGSYNDIQKKQDKHDGNKKETRETIEIPLIKHYIEGNVNLNELCIDRKIIRNEGFKNVRSNLHSYKLYISKEIGIEIIKDKIAILKNHSNNKKLTHSTINNDSNNCKQYINLKTNNYSINYSNKNGIENNKENNIIKDEFSKHKGVQTNFMKNEDKKDNDNIYKAKDKSYENEYYSLNDYLEEHKDSIKKIIKRNYDKINDGKKKYSFENDMNNGIITIINYGNKYPINQRGQKIYPSYGIKKEVNDKGVKVNLDENSDSKNKNMIKNKNNINNSQFLSNTLCGSIKKYDKTNSLVVSNKKNINYFKDLKKNNGGNYSFRNNSNSYTKLNPIKLKGNNSTSNIIEKRIKEIELCDDEDKKFKKLVNKVKEIIPLESNSPFTDNINKGRIRNNNYSKKNILEKKEYKNTQIANANINDLHMLGLNSNLNKESKYFKSINMK